ncbi:MAG: choice-of-anchor L domain-containing protein [Cryomorphaceae bacterium]
MRRLVVFFLSIFISNAAFTQIAIETGDDIIPFLEFGFISHPAMNQASLEYTLIGDTSALAVFNNLDNDFPIETGLVLSSGNATGAVLQNEDFVEGYSNDLDLLGIAVSDFDLFDCASLEIRFTAIQESLNMSFVYASEEYDGFVCNISADPMGIFLKQDQENAVFENIAFVPDTDIPVNINTINGGVPETMDTENCEDANPDWEDSFIYYLENGSGEYGINVHGMTVALEAQADLEIGESYILKLALCDMADGALNSYGFFSFDQSSDLDCPISGRTVGEICYEEGDSTYFANAACECVPVSNGVDLKSEITVNDEVAPGDSISISAKVTNIGLQESESFTLEFYYTEFNFVNTDETEFFHSVSFTGVGYQDTLAYDYSFADYPLPLNDGQDYIHVVINSEEDINEENDTSLDLVNFSNQTSGLVNPQQGFESLIVDPEQTAFDFSFLVYNLDYQTLPFSNVSLYWSTDQELDEDDILVYEHVGGELLPGDTTEVSTDIEIPQPVIEPTYYVILSPENSSGSESVAGNKVVPVTFSALSAADFELSDWRAWMSHSEIYLLPGNRVSGLTTVRLFDAIGNEVLTRKLNLSEKELNSFFLPEMAGGIYLLRIENNNRIGLFKLVNIK